MADDDTKTAMSIAPGYLAARPGYLLKVVERLQRRAMDLALGRIELTTPQYAALSVLADHPGISNAELARRSFVTAQTMTDILRALHRGDLVIRAPHPEHGRIIQYQLTVEGARLRALGDIEVMGIERRMLSRLSESDRVALLGMLKRCADSLEQSPGAGEIDQERS